MSALKLNSKSNFSKDILVNLLPQDAFSQSSAGRILTWALSTGRYIVVFTELIVILTFLSRFTLDRQLTDLNESILKKQAIVESYGDLETQIRDIQSKTKFIKQVDTRFKALDVLDFLGENTPEEIKLDSLIINANSFTLESVSYSPVVLESFIHSLRSNTRFTDVTLSKISTEKNDSGIKFIVSAQFN